MDATKTKMSTHYNYGHETQEPGGSGQKGWVLVERNMEHVWRMAKPVLIMCICALKEM